MNGHGKRVGAPTGWGMSGYRVRGYGRAAGTGSRKPFVIG